MSGRRAIVTLAIGDEFHARWRRLCEENWRHYADRHGYDLICITEPLDDSARAQSRSPSWQKLLVPSEPFAQQYEQLVWVDSDIVFGADPPSVAEGVPVDKVGAVDEVGPVAHPFAGIPNRSTVASYYTDGGFDPPSDEVVQGGLLVVSPAHHAELLKRVYDEHEDPGPPSDYEMRPLSYELLRGGHVHWLDRRFNVLWMYYKALRQPLLVKHPLHPKARAEIGNALEESYCLHFAGQADQMDKLLAPPRHPAAANGTASVRPQRTRAPVVMFIFARPDTTARVLDVVRKARPQQLLVVADGPRPEVAGEAERCAATRELLDTVDWDCDVSTNFADHNLGQTRRLETGLDWAFDLTEEAIVVEDDCLPDPTFFAYCDELLERYRDEERLLTVSGDNFQFERPASEDSYFFSRYPHSYGWASWRRAWSLNDPEMSAWPELRETDWLQGIVGEGHSAAYWSHIFELTHRNRDSWDYAWLFTCWVHGMVNAHPNVNLVSNIGVRDDATNTRPELGTVIADLPTEPIGFPLRHPETLAPNSAADDYTEGLLFGGNMAAMFDRLRRTRRKVRARAAR